MELHKHDALDQLLRTDLLQVPNNFTTEVMQQVNSLPFPAKTAKPLEWLQWLALIGGVLVGIEQLVAFMLGVWALNAAG
ncbi:MAG: hypothetical protein PHE17_03505 [Thiothrix sp.]|uniref:hypothetical protein n=1 Tax=Thiothrix sp. TaxID=1032 RepID=UPI002604FA74|nr:hypothetical protein [Thiothrix sp.]MDD5392067.1 hypothetical protein [Thiothrix sp.]